ncbi:MAG: hypothetical protein DSY77_10235 [Bacteroidetes bacterium]|nr:MAG: hypothetical protein DSY77_10235 [Bacteroidota bacterium]
MKNLTKLWSLILLLTAAMFMVSCEEDEPTIDVDESGVAVSDGYYFTLDEEDPVAEKALLPEKIEGAEFAATDREGFFGNYVFLPAGDYQLKKVQEREVVSTIGGTLEAPEGEDEGYLVAKLTEDGGPITVSEDGYYKVSYDEELAELIMMKVTSVSLIGSATPNGWNADTQLEIAQEASDEGFVFSTSDLVLRAGEFKIRINNRWTIDRRLDREAQEFDPNNGYVAFTNYGGSPDNLVAGGGNMAFAAADEGTYDITITLTNEGGASFESTRTGDAPEITFDPADYQFGFTGSATAGGWDASQMMHYAGLSEGVHTWLGVVTFAADGEFKFKTNNELYLGGTLTLEEASINQTGGNIPSPGAGAYYISLSTADEGETWSASMIDSGWSLIGAGSPSGDWDNDTFLEASFADGITTYTYTGDFVGGEYKFRAGGQWDYALGGDLAALSTDGGNLSVDAGTYTVTLIFDGSSYSATIE